METVRGTWLGTLILGLALAGAAMAKPPAKPASVPLEEIKPIPAEKSISGSEANRFLEILVELAWLADPVTFSYFLEARVEGSTMHVRGFVSSNSVRDHALKIARLQCPMTVRDDLQIRPGIAVRAVKIPAGQLEKAALSSLLVAFPWPDCHFQIQADSAGRIKVLGQVRSLEEKLAISQELRRQHGCTGVVNVVHVVDGRHPEISRPTLKPGMEEASAMGKPITDKPKPTLPKNSDPAQSGKSFWEKMGFAGMNPEHIVPTKPLDFKSKPAAKPPVKEQGQKSNLTATVKTVSAMEGAAAGAPLVTHGTIMVAEEPPAPTPEVRLRKHIVESCGIPEQNLHVYFKTSSDLEIRVQARNQDDANNLAQSIFQVPELFPYHVDLQVTIPK
jgi:hypothetical protein